MREAVTPLPEPGPGPWILTSGGRSFPFLEPGPEDIDPFDIAHALAHTCRFGGSCRTFYSVAQHSLLVSELAPPGFALAGLLHDAAEAYLGDVVTPLKPYWIGLGAVEERILRAVEARFGLSLGSTQAPQVVRADREALAIERAALMPPSADWPADDSLAGLLPVPLEPARAREKFLSRLEPLCRGHVPEWMAW